MGSNGLNGQRRLLDGQVGWLCLFPLSLEHGVTHVEQECDPGDLRHHLSEHFQLLPLYLGGKSAQPRDAPGTLGQNPAS